MKAHLLLRGITDKQHNDFISNRSDR
jgi:hypothetical protein